MRHLHVIVLAACMVAACSTFSWASGENPDPMFTSLQMIERYERVQTYLIGFGCGIVLFRILILAKNQSRFI